MVVKIKKCKILLIFSLLLVLFIGCENNDDALVDAHDEDTESENPTNDVPEEDTETENPEDITVPEEDMESEDPNDASNTFLLLNDTSDIVLVTGVFNEKYRPELAINRAFDARRAEFITDIPMWGTIDIVSDASVTGILWAGGYAHSTKTWDSSWEEHKATSEPDLPGRNSVPFENRAFGTTITGMYVRNVHDGFRSSAATDWRVQHCWSSYVRDDAIENDLFRSGSVYDCLFDGTYAGFSSRPDDDGLDANGNVLYLEKVLVRLQAMPYPFKWDTKPDTIDENNEPYVGIGVPYGHGELFKIFEDNNSRNMHWDIRDCVFVGANNVAGSKFDFPDATLIDNLSNVVIIWLGTGTYPGYLPTEKFPGQITVLTGQEGQDFWTEKVADWHNRHPHVGEAFKPHNPGEILFPEVF